MTSSFYTPEGGMDYEVLSDEGRTERKLLYQALLRAKKSGDREAVDKAQKALAAFDWRIA